MRRFRIQHALPSLALLGAALLAAGCDASSAKSNAAATADSSGSAAATSTTATNGEVASASPAAAVAPGKLDDAPVIRALYVNRWAAQGWRPQGSSKLRHLIAIADSSEINALVIDCKDEMGLIFNSANPEFARNAGTAGRIPNIKALVDTLHAHKIIAIARVVVFKDSVTARVHPEWTIRQPDGSVWRDHKGLAWVNPYHRELWEYNIGIAEELAKAGFDEIQFDYIRFPEPYKSLPQQIFSDNKGQSKPDALAEFLSTARGRLSKLGARTTADIFGLTTTVKGPLEVGQEWEKLSPVTDVLLPMTYPSHYPPGSFNIPRPNAEPQKVLFTAISRAKQRDDKLGIAAAEHVRPWLQAFTLGKPRYGPDEIRQQKQGVYDAGYDGWVLWHPGSNYDIFLPALEKELTSRKKSLATR